MNDLILLIAAITFLLAAFIFGGAIVWLGIKAHTVTIELRKPAGQRKTMAEIIRQVEYL